MPAAAPWEWMNSTIGFQASRCLSVQIPVSRGEMRPSAVTAVASEMTSAAPGGESAEVNEMPWRGHAVLVEHGVLAHGRDPDPIAKSEASDGQRFKQGGQDGPIQW